MTPAEHRRAKDLFQRAEELPPEEREAFLEQAAGGDERLLAEVRRLLRLAGETPEGFLSPPAATVPARQPVAAGRRLGPYKVLSPLGAGAMSEVWRARDTRLGRDVALKLLPPGLELSDERRARFEREARAIAALSHPNILALYDFGRSGGVTYAVMELLEGETLGDRLRRGALPAGEAIGFTLQIARALAAAHGKGIVHRDLKPDNVFVTRDGHVKLVDFGIASWRRPNDGAAPTREAGGRPFDTHPGTVLGTPCYMAPEQVRGQPVDHRSDLFALGCVLYELLTARRAFGRETSAETLVAVLDAEPPAFSSADADLSAALQRIVGRCLEKEPAARFQTALDLVLELEAVRARSGGSPPDTVVAVPGSKPSRLMLAVLPFESIGGDPEQERFADGMTEEMITVLGRAAPHRLGVIARTSAMQFKGQRTTVEAIGRTLGVDYLIEGSVRRHGDRVRVAAKLVQVADQAQIWADSFDGDMGDILALQSDLARRIAGALSVELVPRFQAAGRAPASDPRAYDAYLAGRASFYKASESGWRQAIDYYREAVALDPAFALAHAGIASGHTAWAMWGTTPPAAARASATAAIARARELDPNLAEVHSTLAMIRMFFEWEWDEAEREFRQAIALNPSDGEVHHWYAHYLLFVDRAEEAVDVFAEARRYDPLSTFHRGCLAGHYVAMGELERAEPLLRGILEQVPASPLAHHFLGWLLERRGRIGEAVAAWEEAATISDIPNLLSTVGYGYALAGRLADARAVQDELERRASRAYVAAQDRAKVFAGRGEHDEAFAWLEKAFHNRDTWLAALKMEPGFDALRGDPRFPALLRRIGMPARL